MVRLTGVVKYFHDPKGFGFIQPDDGGAEVFVHRTDLSHGLTILMLNQHVAYDLVDSGFNRDGSIRGNGKKAANVELLKGERKTTTQS